MRTKQCGLEAQARIFLTKMTEEAERLLWHAESLNAETNVPVLRAGPLCRNDVITALRCLVRSGYAALDTTDIEFRDAEDCEAASNCRSCVAVAEAFTGACSLSGVADAENEERGSTSASVIDYGA